jgi:hypothetical protein
VYDDPVLVLALFVVDPLGTIPACVAVIAFMPGP